MSTDKNSRLLYEELTYKIRGAVFAVHNELGPGHKESVYGKALTREFEQLKLPFVTEKVLDVVYKDKKVGVYRPDFIVGDRVIIEIKALPFLPRGAETQMSYYLRGTKYNLGLLVNFGSRKADIRRRIYDIRANP